MKENAFKMCFNFNSYTDFGSLATRDVTSPFINFLKLDINPQSIHYKQINL